jgi:hypothetical protein
MSACIRQPSLPSLVNMDESPGFLPELGNAPGDLGGPQLSETNWKSCVTRAGMSQKH